MTWMRSSSALLLVLITLPQASAQFFPPPVILVPQPGVGFQYNGGRLKIAGFVPSGPYGYGYAVPASMETRITVQVVTPTVIIRRPRSLAPYGESFDLAGIDLDVEPASKIWGEKKPALAKKAEPIPKAELAKVPPPAPPQEKVVDRRPEGVRLLEDGIRAFRNGEYGVALLRFRQSDAERAIFLQAQASIALGRYAEAAVLIQDGLRDSPDWPRSGFRPRIELYANEDAVWDAHRTRVETAQKLAPNNANLHFLLGYLAWFDGERDLAVVHFRASRALAINPRWADLFLKAANGA